METSILLSILFFIVFLFDQKGNAVAEECEEGKNICPDSDACVMKDKDSKTGECMPYAQKDESCGIAYYTADDGEEFSRFYPPCDLRDTDNLLYCSSGEEDVIRKGEAKCELLG